MTTPSMGDPYIFHLAVRELGVEGTHMAKRLKMSQPAVAYAIGRGERIAKDSNFQMIE